MLSFFFPQQNNSVGFSHLSCRVIPSTVCHLLCTDSTENIALQVLAQEPLQEGDNVTLKCVADGNPAPTSFNFHLKVA